MKKLMLLLTGIVVLAYTSAVATPTVHFLYFADTKDADIGETSETNVLKMHYFADKLAGALGYTLNNVEFTGDKFSSHAFENVQPAINPQKDDIIVLYVSGKGIYTPYINGSFPGISFPDRLVAATTAHERLSEMPHHTLLTVIDAADHYRVMDERGYKSSHHLFEQDEMLYPAEAEGRARYANMFNTKRYDAIVSSSGNNEHSLATEAGGVFTNMFLNAISYYTSGSVPISYANLVNVLERTRTNTADISREVCVNYNYMMRQLQRDQINCPASNPVWKISDNNNFSYVLYRTGDSYTGTKGLYERDPLAEAFALDYDVKKLSWDEKGKMQTLADYLLTTKVKTTPDYAGRIRNVKYYYHYTSQRPVQEVSRSNDNYAATTVMYDTFMLRAQVTLDDGTIVNLAREIPLPS